MHNLLDIFGSGDGDITGYDFNSLGFFKAKNEIKL